MRTEGRFHKAVSTRTYKAATKHAGSLNKAEQSFAQCPGGWRWAVPGHDEASTSSDSRVSAPLLLHLVWVPSGVCFIVLLWLLMLQPSYLHSG